MKRVGQYEEAARILRDLYKTSKKRDQRILLLYSLKEIYTRSRDWKSLLTVLYQIQSLDPTESGERYKKALYDTLQRLGKDKDASLFLKARTALIPVEEPHAGSDVVLATIGEEEIYTRDLGNMKGKNAAQKLEVLSQLVIQRLLKKESMGLMEDQEFLREADEVLEQMRISRFLKLKLSREKISEFDLKNFYHSHLYLWNHPYGMHVSHMMLDSEDQAEELLSRESLKLEDFETYAHKNSKSLDRVLKGHHKRWIESDSIPGVGTFQGLFEFLQPQKKGLAGPFKSRRGIHFFWIRNHRTARNSTFEDSKEEVRTAYRKDFEKEFKEKYFRELLGAHDVKVFTDRL